MNNGETPSPSPDKEHGLICPRCECQHFYTRETRQAPNNRIRRRKECRHCGKIICTYEEIRR